MRGVIQHYDWGGFEYLPSFIGRENSERDPWAELWLGAHPKGSAQVRTGGSTRDLRALLDDAPDVLLGPTVSHDYDRQLPFLLKVLDVREMLSIQAHPTRAAAEAGYERENEANIPLNAPHRNYRDRNHKPELGVALTDFYLLHGFQSATAIGETFERIPAWAALREPFERGGIKGLYQYVMELPQTEVDHLLSDLHQRLTADAAADVLRRDQADFWAQRAFEQYTRDGHYDRGVFSIYWFNLVHLRPGEGIFQAAGIPHAYLEGVNVELMANSDNVLRGGLTPKHIDVPELLNNLVFDAVEPQILQPEPIGTSWQVYRTPAPDFSLSVSRLPTDATTTVSSGPAIFLLTEGEISIDGGVRYKMGDAFFLPHEVKCSLRACQPSTVFCASVGNS